MRILIIGIFLFLAACSSSQKSGPSASSNQEGLVDMTDVPHAGAQESAALPPAVESEPNAPSTTVDATNAKLDAAIKKQDERGIAIAAREILIRTPNDIKALNALGLYHYRRGEIDLAKALIAKAIAADPKVSMLYANLGLIHQTQKDLGEAIRSYREALRLDPYNPVAAANLGSIYADQLDYRKAQAALEVAVTRGQRDWKTLNNYGVSLMAIGKYNQAEVQLKRATELQPQSANVLMNYAILLIDHLAKPSEGLDVISKIRLIGTGPDLRKQVLELENRAKSGLK